jgi:hypothetical protein
MTTALGTKRRGRAASAGALGLMVLTFACGSAFAQPERAENDPSVWNLDSRLWDGLMSAMGMRAGTEVGIDYRERSPLVVPPQATLPPPESGAPKNAAWPVEPEVKRRQEANSRKARSAGRAVDIETYGRNLSPSELNNPATRSASASAGPGGPGESTDTLLPSQLGYIGGLFSLKKWGTPTDEVATFTNEPARTELTAPPVGYQTPSPAQPYGVTKRIEFAKPKKVEDWGNN